MSIYPKVYRNKAASEKEAGQLVEEMSYSDLYELAQQRGIRGRSHMTKEELIDALR